MAADATTVETVGSLQRLAARFRKAARELAFVRAHQPGETAAWAGPYDLLNVTGDPAGPTVEVSEGQPFPAAPPGFTWRLCRGRDPLQG